MQEINEKRTLIMTRKMSDSRIMKYSGLMLAIIAAGPNWAQESGSRSPVLWASHVYLADAQFVTCADVADPDAIAVPCDVSLLIVETLKGAQQSQTTVTIHTNLPRVLSADAGDPWHALDVDTGDRLLLYTVADGKLDRQDRLFGERLRLATGGDSAQQTQDIADIRQGLNTLQAGDAGAAALQELTSGKDWGALYAQLAWEILEPKATGDSALFQQVCSGIENAQAQPAGRAALVTEAFRYYIQIAPSLDNGAVRAFVQSLVSVLARDSDQDRAIHAFMPVPLDFIFARNSQGDSLANLAPQVKARAASNLRLLGDDRAANVASYVTRE
jgi:hypothetical protein